MLVETDGNMYMPIINVRFGCGDAFAYFGLHTIFQKDNNIILFWYYLPSFVNNYYIITNIII